MVLKVAHLASIFLTGFYPYPAKLVGMVLLLALL